MKLFKLLSMSLIAVCILGCNDDEISEMKKENSKMINEVRLLKMKVQYLENTDSVYMIQMQALASQDNKTLDLIGMHLKYNH